MNRPAAPRWAQQFPDLGTDPVPVETLVSEEYSGARKTSCSGTPGSSWRAPKSCPRCARGSSSRCRRGWGGGTRIGDSVAGFLRHWSRRMAVSEAEVLLISDGLDLGPGEPLEQEMARLTRASHRLIWLNPLLKFSAYAPLAAGARAIARHANETRPIHDLASIEALVKTRVDASRAVACSPFFIAKHAQLGVYRVVQRAVELCPL